ncbi:MAG: WD40 repeat domain-containing serine/threonine protein kinase [Planctomycetota bacterium]
MPPPSTRSDGAWELFNELLQRSGLDDPGLLEDVLARHPDHADELREMCADYRRSADLLARLGTDEVERVLFEAAEAAPSIESIDLAELCRQHAALAFGLRRLHGEATAGRARLRAVMGEGRFAEGPIAGRFTPLTELGRGGMSIVVAAWDSHLRRKVALKCLRPTIATVVDPDRLRRRAARLMHEAQVLAQLDHPAIVPVYDVVCDQSGSPFVAMLRVRGVDLRTIYRRSWQHDSAWPLPRVVGTIHRVCEALAYAHDKGVLHRDLKPANVMIGSFGETYLMDWGLARTGHGDESVAASTGAADLRSALDGSISIVQTDRDIDGADLSRRTQQGEIVGTPSYMSPEQADGRVDAVGPHSDVYGIGAMIYELLAGHAPYAKPDSSSSSEEILSALRATAPPALAALAPAAPNELVAIAEKAMARDPRRRYASMRDLAEDLRAYLEGRVVHAYRTGAFAELRKWFGRHRSLAIALLALIATLGISLVAVLNLLWDSQRSLYLSRIAQASTSFEAGRFREMREALHETVEEYRDWEWGHLLARSDDCVWESTLDEATQKRLIAANDGSVHGLAVSPDGRLVAASHRDGAIRLLDARDGGSVGELRHLRGVTAVVFSPVDPQQLLSASWDRTVRSWNLAEKRAIREWKHADEVFALAISRDGRRVFSGSRDGWIQSIDPSQDSFTRRWHSHRGPVTAVAISPDDRHLASVGLDLTIAIWNADTGALERRIERSVSRDRIGGADVLVHGQPIGGLAFHATGKFLFSASEDGFGKMWDVETGELLFFEAMGHPLGQSAVSPDGTILAIGGQDVVRLRNAQDGRPLEPLRGHVAAGGSIAFGPDSSLIVAGAVDGSVRAYQRARRSGAYFFDHRPHKVWSVAVSDDGSTIAASYEDGTVSVYRSTDLGRSLSFRAHRSRIREVALDVTGGRIATASDDRTVRLFDSESGRELAQRSAPGRPRIRWRNRTLVMIGDADAAVVLDEHSLATLRELPLGAGGATLAIDGRGRIAVGTASGSVKVFAARSGEVVREFVAHPKSGVSALLFLDDGTLASSGTDSAVCTWSLPEGSRLARTLGIGAVGLAQSPSGRRLIACPMRDDPRVLQRDDLSTLIELVGHEPGTFLCGVVSLGDGRFVTGDSAGALRVWGNSPLRAGR